MYAKYLNEQEIQYYPGNVLRYGGKCYSNPRDEIVVAAGFKPIVEGEKPEIGDGEILVISYTDTPNCIIRCYTAQPIE